MLWSPHGHEDGVNSLLGMVDVTLIDTDDEDVCGGLTRAAERRESSYVVDLAWLRTTPWRERLAASFDQPHRRQALQELRDVCVRHEPGSRASAALLAGWLASRLHWEPEQLEGGDGRRWRGAAKDEEGSRKIEITLTPTEQEVPGLVGVTVSWEGCSLSLDRGPGGLSACQRSADGEEWCWRVLGASRGEGGILGEGVRQALLRDTTYAHALEAAMTLSGVEAR
jgi:glucose-6-phosphate dehydrogenase assembly protein OpcA